MTLLPIVGRELRAASRRRSTYWARTITAGTALLLGVVVFKSSGWLPPAELAMALFAGLSWLTFLSCLLSGVRLTADCISEERREGTLGLLFLTDLKGYDIALGKLAACSMHAFYATLGVVPILAVALLLGGVSAVQVGQTSLMLATTMLYSLALGLFVSLWFLNGRPAALTTGLVLAATCLGPFVAMLVMYRMRLGTGGAFPLPPFEFGMYSPLYAQTLAVFGEKTMMLPGPAPGFWSSYSVLAVQALVLLTLSSLLLPRVWRDRAHSATGSGWRSRWRQWRRGTPASRSRFRQRLLEVNPFFWLAARNRWHPYHVWSFLALTAAAAVGLRLVDAELWRDMGLERYVMLSVFLHLVLRLWVAGAASRQLLEDRRAGTFELLLSTPLSVGQICAGQSRALYRQFGAAFGAVLLADLAFCWACFREEPGFGAASILLWAGCMALLILDSYALAWQGMWCAISVRQPNRATLTAVVRVMALPWVVLLSLAALYQMLELDRRLSWDITDKMVFGLWFGLGLAVDLLMVSLARARLRAHFRQHATGGARPGGVWPTLAGWVGNR